MVVILYRNGKTSTIRVLSVTVTLKFWMLGASVANWSEKSKIEDCFNLKKKKSAS